MKHKTLIFLILILLTGTFFRLWQLDSAPPGLYHDEAINGNNALEAVETNNYKWFYPDNNGREGLYINLATIPLSIFGNQPWALRLVSAIFGILTILGLFLLTKEMFNTRVALFTSFFLTTSFWHILFSRIGFRAIMAPFFLVWSFYLLFKITNKFNPEPETSFWYRARIQNFYAVAAGFLFGLGFHTYIAYRIAPPLLIIPFIILWRQKKKKIIFIFLVAAFVAGLPLGWYFLNNPADFLGRTSQISIFSSETLIKDLGINIAKTVGMLFYRGDFNWRHNMAGESQLFWPVALLFVLGLIIGTKSIIQNSKIKNQNDNAKLKILFLFSWLFVMSLPVIISSEGLPHALRAIILIPPIMIFAGLGLEFIVQKVKKWHELTFKKYPDHQKQLLRIQKHFTILLFIFSLLLFLTPLFSIFKDGRQTSILITPLMADIWTLGII